MSFHCPEKYRDAQAERQHLARYGVYVEKNLGDFGGCFLIPGNFKNPVRTRIIASAGPLPGDAQAWEHVSVTVQAKRCPTWEEMCRVKALFWDPEDCVLQFHPPESDYVSYHNYCLHLWRPVGVEILRPPALMVGPR